MEFSNAQYHLALITVHIKMTPLTRQIQSI